MLQMFPFIPVRIQHATKIWGNETYTIVSHIVPTTTPMASDGLGVPSSPPLLADSSGCVMDDGWR